MIKSSNIIMDQIDDVSVQVCIFVLTEKRCSKSCCCLALNATDLSEKEDRLESEETSSLSCFILAVSLLLVSENWLAITTRHKLIMKKVPTMMRITK